MGKGTIWARAARAEKQAEKDETNASTRSEYDKALAAFKSAKTAGPKAKARKDALSAGRKLHKADPKFSLDSALL